MVDEDHERPEALRDLRDHLAHVHRLLVGEPGCRLVQEHDAGLADRRPRDLEQAPVARAQHARLLPGRDLETDEGERVGDVLAAGGACLAGVLVHHGDVVEHRQARDRLLLLERAPKPPAGATEVGHLEEVLPEGADRPGGGLDEPAQHVEEGRLAGPVGADQAARPARERHGHVVDRRHAAEANGQTLDLDHAAGPSASARRPKPRESKRPSLFRSFGTWSASPPGAVARTCSTPIPKRSSET